MWELLAELSEREALVRIALLFAAIAALTGLGALVVSKFRGSSKDEERPASEMLSNFRNLHEQGELSETEFRNIKTLLSDKIQEELKDSEEQG
jgi:hypothetical protein